MNFPPPTEKQARVIWLALTGLAVAIILALVVGAVWGLGRVLHVLSSVIWPIAVAGVLAYLLDPVVDFFERRHVPRTRAIGLVFLIALFLVLGVFGSVVPRLVVETRQLFDNVPGFVAKLESHATKWINEPPVKLQNLLQRLGVHWPGASLATNTFPEIAVNTEPVSTNTVTSETRPPPALAPAEPVTPWPMFDQAALKSATGWLAKVLPNAGAWLAHAGSYLATWFGVLAGLALVPIYLFYLLLEKRAIAENWTGYLPVRDSGFKEELVFVLRSINDYLIAFFRGQVLVAMCDGVLYGIGFAIIGLPYAFLIGAVAMVLTIIPFLGAMVTCGSALLIALVSGDWHQPLGVVIVFAVVQGIEGYLLQPKIIGDRVGLHPMAIIIAIMTGTTLLGGILGGLLAIPLAAALRVIMFRYVWRNREG